MVAERGCVLRLWFVALESCHDGYVGRTAGAVGTITAAGWDFTASSELHDATLEQLPDLVRMSLKQALYT